MQDMESEFFSSLSKDHRVCVRRPGMPKREGKCVVYWMQRAQRGTGNPALDVAVSIANELRLPLVVLLIIIPSYPHANWRHFHFLGQGLPEIGGDLEEKGIGFVVRLAKGKGTLEQFLEEVDAACLVGDENHCREPEKWRKEVSRRLEIPYWTVDADVLVPSSLFTKHFYLLHHFRPKLYAEFDKYLVPDSDPHPMKAWKKKIEGLALEEDFTKEIRGLDKSVRPVESFQGGPHQALKRLKTFVSGVLKDYGEKRNFPEVAGTSQLSPYLHFGHIGPRTIVWAVEEAVKKGKATKEVRDSFVNELIGWRELAINFVKHTPNYDSWECAEPWAQKSLTAHIGDRRDHLYSLEQLEKAETYDDLWNAAQQQMVDTGWMHNYMRMYWAKKILEWTPNPSVAFDYAVVLNDKYELDGRDPNGYAGIAWAIVGKHDRPWFDRPIFGTVRYMSGASTGKKFDSKRYIQQNLNREPGLF